MKVAFLINDLQLSGGVGVIVNHARRLAALEGWDVTLVTTSPENAPRWHGHPGLESLHVCSREEALRDHFDIALATWWETVFTLFELSAERHAYFVQSLEDRFYHSEQFERLGAALTIDLPVTFITEARWIADTLAQLRPDAPCYLVRNGIDKDTFAPAAAVEPAARGPLRVLVEGYPQVWFKHVPDAIEAAGAMHEPHRLTVVTPERAALGSAAFDEVLGPLSPGEMADVYRRSHVVLKLSSVEGMFGPPLEGFHCGATCVVTPVTGHEEYVEHGFNGLICDWDDVGGTARLLDLLARDRELLHYLRTNALETARAWPSWDQSSQFMAAALLAIRREPQPTSAATAACLLADVRAGIHLYGAHMHERADFARRAWRFERRLEQLRRSLPVRVALRLRRNRVVRIAARPLRPLIRRARRALT